MKRNAYLDLARGLSAQLVLIGHVMSWYWLDAFNVRVSGGWNIKPGVFYVQNLGLIVFFYHQVT